ncbi:mannitol dehydrogenase domain protein [Nitratireductor pacificus pht-3B]|uniref:Mannitol dehydrogenase domain protein n=1 Tax=Nitratireductor pacificus pht-3B TaxID=391937 RepID=K2N8R0_9HYPH|nr:mannitol dehydrogenase domain protein [Nitratireductor pacificus pht-3B]
MRAGIVHIGVGAFHRAHQAAYVDACLAEGDMAWGIIGVSLRSPAMRDALAPQDWLYALAERDGTGETLKVIGSVMKVLVAPEDPQAVLAALSDPQTRIVTLTVTEKAYPRGPDGGLDTQDRRVAADLANPERPTGTLGFLTEALAQRQAEGTPPFTVLSCDNLPSNGETLRRLVIEFAALRDPELAQHIEQNVAFPSSMVDRIVPATTDADRERVAAALGAQDAWPVVTEPFMQWVVEDDFPMGRPAWERHGVEMVADVAPFEEMKLRLLNGAHSALAYAGQLLGRETVADAFADPLIHGFVKGLWRESARTLSGEAGLMPDEYTARLADRFANPALRHRTAQIANDGSQKLPQRFINPLLERLDSGGSAPHLAAGVALWIAALASRGDPPAFTDPLDETLKAAIARTTSPADTVAAVLEACRFDGIDRYLPAVIEDCQRMETDGVAGALAHYARGE